MPLLATSVSSSGGENMSPFVDKLPVIDTQLHVPLTVVSISVSSTIDSINADA